MIDRIMEIARKLRDRNSLDEEAEKLAGALFDLPTDSQYTHEPSEQKTNCPPGQEK